MNAFLMTLQQDGKLFAGTMILDENYVVVKNNSWVCLGKLQDAFNEMVEFLLDNVSMERLTNIKIHTNNKELIDLQETVSGYVCVEGKAGEFFSNHPEVKLQLAPINPMQKELFDKKTERTNFRMGSFTGNSLTQVHEHIFIAHGTEDYAVDTLHRTCSCPSFRGRGMCKHLVAALGNV